MIISSSPKSLFIACSQSSPPSLPLISNAQCLAAPSLTDVWLCWRQWRPGFIFNLDFFHAFNRVCLPYLDCVLEAMGFGATFRAVVAMLNDRAAATFLLQTFMDVDLL